MTTGSNGVYSAHPGYDLVTGLGSPVSDEIIGSLSGLPVKYIPNEPAAVSAQASPAGGSSSVPIEAMQSSSDTATSTRQRIDASSHARVEDTAARLPSFVALACHSSSERRSQAAAGTITSTGPLGRHWRMVFS